MVHVNYFLDCVKLETGGIILAWLHIIWYTIATLFCIAQLIFYFPGATHQIPTEVIIVTAIVALLILIPIIAVIVVAYRSIRAIKTRNHKIMMEMVGTMFGIAAIYLYIFFIQIWLMFDMLLYCLPALISFAIYCYFFIVVYSLYRVFRKEYEHQLEQQLKVKA